MRAEDLRVVEDEAADTRDEEADQHRPRDLALGDVVNHLKVNTLL